MAVADRPGITGVRALRKDSAPAVLIACPATTRATPAPVRHRRPGIRQGSSRSTAQAATSGKAYTSGGGTWTSAPRGVGEPGVPVTSDLLRQGRTHDLQTVARSHLVPPWNLDGHRLAVVTGQAALPSRDADLVVEG